jgi:hypothetical protein
MDDCSLSVRRDTEKQIILTEKDARPFPDCFQALKMQA